ncbi:MAG: hypothetical protein ACPGYV_06595, partial [Phycisphaeraceae bacterium]
MQTAATSPAEQAELLILLTKIQEFDPVRTARAIAPLLLEMPGDALLAINDDLDKLLEWVDAGTTSTLAHLDGEHLFAVERLIVSPGAGIFVP